MCAQALLNGIGVAKDLCESKLWWRRAAEQGHAGAQFNLGVLVLSSKEGVVNEAEALMWFHKAAEQGMTMAQHNFGVCLQQGTGCDKDERQAAIWLDRARKQGLKAS